MMLVVWRWLVVSLFSLLVGFASATPAAARAQSQINLTDPDWVITGFDLVSWNGSLLFIQTQVPTSTGADLTGYADWYSNGVFRGRESFTGTLSGNTLSLLGYHVTHPSSIQPCAYQALVSTDGFNLTNGTWLGLVQPISGVWSATRGGSGCPLITTYCTPGTSSSGCLSTLSASGSPSAAATSGFTITAANVEGQRAGAIFYGVLGAQATPWGAGSSSFVCVGAPFQRTWPSASGGTLGSCNGSLSVDWNLFVSSYAGALGAPFAAGDEVWCQAWFRDPASPKSTSLSSALRFVVCP